jgi:hypothetical protein
MRRALYQLAERVAWSGMFPDTEGSVVVHHSRMFFHLEQESGQGVWRPECEASEKHWGSTLHQILIRERIFALNKSVDSKYPFKKPHSESLRHRNSFRGSRSTTHADRRPTDLPFPSIKPTATIQTASIIITHATHPVYSE